MVSDRELNHNCTPVSVVPVRSDDDVVHLDSVLMSWIDNLENSSEDTESGSEDLDAASSSFMADVGSAWPVVKDGNRSNQFMRRLLVHMRMSTVRYVPREPSVWRLMNVQGTLRTWTGLRNKSWVLLGTRNQNENGRVRETKIGP